jgi:hypothetical protein
MGYRLHLGSTAPDRPWHVFESTSISAGRALREVIQRFRDKGT